MSEMTWKVLISDERFIGIGVEFQVAVRNTHGHLSQTVGLGGLTTPGCMSYCEDRPKHMITQCDHKQLLEV